MSNTEPVTARQAMERYVTVLRGAESSLDAVVAQLAMIRNDSALPINRERLDAISAQVMVAEMALDALAAQVTAFWQRMQREG